MDAWAVLDVAESMSPFVVYADHLGINVWGMAVGGSDCLIVRAAVTKQFTSFTNFALKLYYGL